MTDPLTGQAYPQRPALEFTQAHEMANRLEALGWGYSGGYDGSFIEKRMWWAESPGFAPCFIVGFYDQPTSDYRLIWWDIESQSSWKQMDQIVVYSYDELVLAIVTYKLTKTFL